MESNHIIYQVPHGHSFILGFYGRCDNDGNECVDYDMTLRDFRDVVDSVYQVDGQQSGTTFGWYKESLVGNGLNHFNTLKCGHLYYFVIKPGTSKIVVPHLYITNNSADKLYSFDSLGRITKNCENLPPKNTPTPTPVERCCDGMNNSVITLGNQVGTETLNGLKTFGFEFGGIFCYDNLLETGLPSRYNFKTSDSKIIGYITTTGNFVNKKVVYNSTDGTCYNGYAELDTEFNILEKG